MGETTVAELTHRIEEARQRLARDLDEVVARQDVIRADVVRRAVAPLVAVIGIVVAVAVGRRVVRRRREDRRLRRVVTEALHEAGLGDG